MIYGRVFTVEWSRGSHVYTQTFAPMDVHPGGLPRAGESETDCTGTPLHLYQRVYYPKESALRYAEARRDFGGTATVYEVVNGIRYIVNA